MTLDSNGLLHLNKKARSSMSVEYFRCAGSIGKSLLPTPALAILLLTLPRVLTAQSVPQALESPAAGPPQIGTHGEKLVGMPKFHDPAPYDIDEHSGYKEIFNGKDLSGWDADLSIWRVENGVMVGETFDGKPKGNNYIVYRGDKTRDFNLKLQMKIERAVVVAFSTEALLACRGRARNRRMNLPMI
jgi:hypothetical protein